MTTTSASRHWPTPGGDGAEYAELGHKHRQPRLILSTLLVAIVGLALAVSLLFVYAFRVEERLLQTEDYIAGRGEYRDAEADRLDRRIDTVVCDILGEFPAGDARADRLRTRYECPIPDRPTEGAP